MIVSATPARRPLVLAGGLLLALLAVAVTTALGRALHANAPTIGFVYLVVVVVTALRSRDLAAAFATSLAATACYNYFFFPPVGTFTIAEPSNWVALGTFLLASVLVTRLVARSERRARDAEARRREVEALYELSLDVFTAPERLRDLEGAAARALRTLGAAGGRLELLDRPRSAPAAGGEETLVETVARRGEAVELPAADGARDVYLPLSLGGRTVGVLSALGTRATRDALGSVGHLLALAIERERLLAEQTRLDALRESEALKTSLLRAVSHDLRTPVTSIRLGLEGLDRRLESAERRDDVRALRSEVERLSHRIDNLLSMARIEAGTLSAAPEPTPVADLFRAALDQLPLVLEGRAVEATVAPDAPDAQADPALAVEVLVNLLENAARVSPHEQPIELAADVDAAGALRIDVRDRGPGLPAAVKGGDAGRGLGLEICRGLVRAMGGAVSLLDRPGGGTVARVTLPAARMDA